MGSQSTINTPMETLVTPSKVEGYGNSTINTPMKTLVIPSKVEGYGNTCHPERSREVWKHLSPREKSRGKSF